MREGKWELLCEYDGSDPLLYDLSRNAGETENLAGQQPEVVARLSRQLLAWHQSMPPENGASFRVQGNNAPTKKNSQQSAELHTHRAAGHCASLSRLAGSTSQPLDSLGTRSGEIQLQIRPVVPTGSETIGIKVTRDEDNSNCVIIRGVESSSLTS